MFDGVAIHGVVMSWYTLLVVLIIYSNRSFHDYMPI